MGVSSSSISQLPTNEYLLRFCSVEHIVPSDPFWNQLLSYSFRVPSNSPDQRLLEETVSLLCKNVAINNCRTGNLGSLIRVFILRANEVKSSPDIEDDIFISQTYNALFIIRNITKYFVENLSEEVIIQQFEASTAEPNGMMGSDIKGPLIEELMNCLMQLIVDVPVRSFTYGLHLESVLSLLVLLSSHMYQTTPADHSVLYRYFMNGKCSIHACLLTKALLTNFIEQIKCPKELTSQGYDDPGIIASVTYGLWSVVTLGMGSTAEEALTPPSEAVLANHSLLLLLITATHCTNVTNLHNPYREALFSFTNSQVTSDPSSPTQATSTFKMDLSKLYDGVTKNLRDDQATLLLYLLLHQNKAVRSFFLSRSNLDQLVIPILKILYDAPQKNSHHIYMGLIVLLILSEDDTFNTAVHDIQLTNVGWFKERPIVEISLGGILILVVIRTIQYNMTKMRDKYLHTNCLAALANMSARFKNLHPYVAQRLVSLYAILLKKHTRLIEQLNQSSIANESDSLYDSDNEDYASDLAVLEEVIRMVLEIINSCFCHSVSQNHNLIYTVLYQKDSFQELSTHPSFQDIIQNIEIILSHFTQLLERGGKSISVSEVHETIKQGTINFKKDRLKKFPELKFKYVEEEKPEEFFIPYVWSLVYHSSILYFNTTKIHLFSLPSRDSTDVEHT